MRKKYSMINMLAGVGGQTLNMLMLFISRMVFIRYLSTTYLGVDGLFTEVLGMLNLAELGIGSAMIFSMYRPVALEDHEQIARLMNLYKILYRCVAAFVMLAGLCLMPFLEGMLKDRGGAEIEHLQLIYLLYLVQSSSSYLLSYKNSILLAYQKAYIRLLWEQVFKLVQIIGQIIVLILTGNFILYLAIQMIAQFMINVAVSIGVDKDYPYLKKCRQFPSRAECRHIVKNIGAMSMHRLATVIVSSTDNMIMTAYIGLTTVGVYSNYRLVISGINNLLGKVASAFAGSIGNLCATEESDKVYEVYRVLDFGMFLLFGYVAGGLALLFNAFIRIWCGEGYLFPTTVVMMMVIQFYLAGMRQINLQFRSAMGLFWEDRYKAVFEAAINLIASLFLVRRYGVAGVIGGTIISTLTTCFWMEPYVLLRYGIQTDWLRRLVKYFADYGVRTASVCAAYGAAYMLCRGFADHGLFGFVGSGMLYTVIFAAVMLALYGRTPEFKYFVQMAANKRKKAGGGHA